MNRFVRSLFACACTLALAGCASLGGASKTSTQQINKPPMAQAIANPKTDPASGLKLARMLVEQQRLEGAVGIYNQLARRGVLTPAEYLEYADVAAQIIPPAQTLNIFRAAEKLAQEQGTQWKSQELARLHTGLGRGELASGRSEAAINYLSQAVAADAQNVAAWNAYGVALSSINKPQEAVAAFDKAIALQPANARLRSNKALALCSERQYKPAVKELLAAEKADPKDPTIQLNLAFLHWFSGDQDRARERLSQFLRPSQVEAFEKQFADMTGRIDAGASTLNEEMLRGADQLVDILPQDETQAALPYGTPAPVLHVLPDGNSAHVLQVGEQRHPVDPAAAAQAVEAAQGQAVSDTPSTTAGGR